MNKPVILDEDWEQFLQLRERIFKTIEEIIEDPNATWKSYEGRFDLSVSFPNYFERDTPPDWSLHFACYLIGPNRGEDWFGVDFHSVLIQAERTIGGWLGDHKQEAERVE